MWKENSGLKPEAIVLTRLYVIIGKRQSELEFQVIVWWHYYPKSLYMEECA